MNQGNATGRAVPAVLHVRYDGASSRFLDLTYRVGDRVYRHSASLGELRPRKSGTLGTATLTAALRSFFRQKVLSESAGRLPELGVLQVTMVFQAPGWVRTVVMKVCQSRSIAVLAYVDATPEAFNGVRPKATRRV